MVVNTSSFEGISESTTQVPRKLVTLLLLDPVLLAESGGPSQLPRITSPPSPSPPSLPPQLPPPEALTIFCPSPYAIPASIGALALKALCHANGILAVAVPLLEGRRCSKCIGSSTGSCWTDPSRGLGGTCAA